MLFTKAKLVHCILLNVHWSNKSVCFKNGFFLFQTYVLRKVSLLTCGTGLKYIEFQEKKTSTHFEFEFWDLNSKCF